MIIDVGKDTELYDFQKEMAALFGPAKKMLITIARQCGKSRFIREAIVNFVFTFKKKRNPIIVILTPSVDQSLDLYYNKLMEEGLEKLPKSVCWKTGSVAGGRVTLHVKRGEGDVARVLFMGANSNTRGLTVDLLIADEMAFLPDTLILSTYFPMLDQTGGKFLGSSTVNGENYYYDMVMGYRELMKTDPEYAEYSKNIYEAGVRTKEWIQKKEKEYRAAGQYHLFRQEYLNDFQAAGAKESPFGNLVWEAKREHRVRSIAESEIMPHRYVAINLDIGDSQNFRGWVWVYNPYRRKFLIIDYIDCVDGMRGLPKLLKEKYKKVPFIDVYFPHDAGHPAITEGGTRLDVFQRQVKAMRLTHQIRSKVLRKPANRAALLVRGQEFFNECEFDHRTAQGLTRLSGVRLKVEAKTGHVSPDKFVKNGHEHTADAWCYIPTVLDENEMFSHPGSHLSNMPIFALGGGWGVTYKK